MGAAGDGCGSVDVMQATERNALTYRALFRVPGFRRLAAATGVARAAQAMQSLVLVLFVLERFHAPALAGLVVFVNIVPGLLVSPVAGALLDRHHRMRLVMADYVAASAVLTAVVVLDLAGRLPVALLIGIVAAGSLTNPLSNSGTRSLFPVIVPRTLWERANAVDSGAYVVAAIVGPALGGVLISGAGVRVALLGTAALFVVGLVLLIGMTDPAVETTGTTTLLRDAAAGLGYVVRHRQLRGLAVVTSVSNVAYGVLTVGMPVLLLDHLHSGAGTVGAMYAVLGVAGLASVIVAGRLDSEGREVWLIVAGCAGCAASMALMLAAALGAGGLAVVAAAAVAFGLANGPFDIGLFSLRQRVTAPAWLGRAFAVSMSLNFIGMPVGSAIAGPVVTHSVAAAFAVAVAVDVAAGVAAVLMLRAGMGRDRHPAARGTTGTATTGPRVQSAIEEQVL